MKECDTLYDTAKTLEDAWRDKSFAVGNQILASDEDLKAIEDAEQKYLLADKAADRYYEENADAITKEINSGLNTIATLGYGTLGAGITLPTLYLAYLRKKKKSKLDTNKKGY